MRRSPVWLLVLAAAFGFSCAYGKNALPKRGADGDGGGAATTNPENEHEPDPGSTDPGGGDTTNPDGDGDPTTDPGGGTASGGGTTSGSTSDPGTTTDPGGDPFQCAHDPCVAGVALDASCDPCVSETCAADAFCCENEWDQQCVDEATACGCGTTDPGGDPGGGSTCDHDVCIPGPALAQGCSECADAVCAIDDFCCTDEWDIYCALEAISLCNECG